MPRTSGYKNRGKNNPNSYRNQTTKTTTNTPPTTTSVQDNKPVYDKKFARSQSANAGMNNRMSYPIKDSPSERTGDRLLIRCLQFEPPKDNAGLSVTLTNAYKTVMYVPTPKDIKEAYADNGIVYANKYLKSFTSQIYKF